MASAGKGGGWAAGGADGGEGDLVLTGSRHFPAWLGRERVSLAFTTYQAGKVFFIGLGPDGRLSIFERTFPRCMGLWADGQRLWMSSLFQMWRFENGLGAGELHEGYDRMYVPRAAYTTGDLDIHDTAVDADGRVVFVSTLFSCLATLSPTRSFTPLWRPPFVSSLSPEDRCHLNGLAMVDGQPGFVTAVSRSDVADGWRDHRRDGGVVVDVRSGQVVAAGLSMPHSPRWHNGRLWLLNSGRGEFGYLDRDSGAFVPVAFVPGYARGLVFVGSTAIVGLSRPRDNRTFAGLDLDEQLANRHASAQCGLQLIDVETGTVTDWLKIDGVVNELYDVVALAGVVRPMALGLRSDEIQRLLTVDAGSPLITQGG